MNIVSFETALRLKEAGFPQPEFRFGQTWYDKYGTTYIIGNYQKRLVARSVSTTEWEMLDGPWAPLSFAPSATDILPGYFFLTREISGKTPSGERWVVYDMDHNLVCPYEPETDNPSEACAQAWLKLNNK